MKALIVHPGPAFSVADVHNGLVKGLQACGVTTHSFNLDDRLTFYNEAHINRDGRWVKAFSVDAATSMAAKGLETVLYEWWPDLVILVSGFFIPGDVYAVLARRPHHVVLWCTESPYEDGKQLIPAEYVDTVILNDPTNIDQFRAINPRTYFQPHSYDPDIHHPGAVDPELRCDFGFVGTGFPSRVEFFNQVDWKDLRVSFAGNWPDVTANDPIHHFLINERSQCIDNVDTARLYRSAGMSANLYRREILEGGTADGWACGPREIELAACGTFFLREPRPETDLLLPMLPSFGSVDEFQDLLHWWHNHPVERKDAALAARVAVSKRTFTNTAAHLLRLVDDHIKQPL